MKQLISLLVLLCIFPQLALSESPIDVYSRGNTAIMCIPEKWLDEHHSFEEYKDVETWRDSWFGIEGDFFVDEVWVKEMLGEEKGNVFLKEHYESQDAFSYFYNLRVVTNEGFVRKDPDHDRLGMSVRKINENWYVVFRQDRINPEYACYIKTISVRSQGTQLVAKYDEIGLPLGTTFTVEKFSGSPIWSAEYNSLQLTLFYTANAYILVLKEQKGGSSDLRDRDLYLGDFLPITITGYKDGSDAIFCCVLTNEEAEFLLSGGDKHIKLS